MALWSKIKKRRRCFRLVLCQILVLRGASKWVRNTAFRRQLLSFVGKSPALLDTILVKQARQMHLLQTSVDWVERGWGDLKWRRIVVVFAIWGSMPVAPIVKKPWSMIIWPWEMAPSCRSPNVQNVKVKSSHRCAVVRTWAARFSRPELALC